MNINSEAFNLLRPVCISLSQITFAQNEESIIDNSELPSLLNELNTLLTKLLDANESLSPKLGDYIFIPISSMLKTCKDIPEQLVILLFRVLSKVTRLCWSGLSSIEDDVFAQLFAVCTFLISPTLENSNLLEKSMDFQMEGIDMLNSFYGTATFQKKEQNILTTMAHSITILLLLSEDGEREVQLKSLSTLNLLFESLNDGEILSNVLPGIVSSFMKTISKPGITTHYRVVCSALLALKTVLSLVYNDKALGASISMKSGNLEINLQNPGRHRDIRWLRASSLQLKRAFEGIFPKLVRRDNAFVNSSLFDLCLTVLESGKHSLFYCKEALINTALMCQGGDLDRLHVYQDEIASYLRSDRFSVTTEFKETKQFVLINNALKVLDEDILSKFKIPYLILSRINESMKAQIEKSVLGVRNISRVEVTSLELSTTEIKFNPTALQLPNISKDTYENILKTLQNLGSVINPSHLENMVTTLLSQDDNVTIEPVHQLWIASNLVYGHKISNAASFLKFANDEQLICQYDILETANEYVSTLLNRNELDRIQNSNMSIALFSIKQMIETMGSDFQHELLDYIYNIVECFTLNNEMIKSISGDILSYLSQYFYGGSMVDMLQDNIDYLVDGISIRLDNCLLERSYMVLRVLVKFSGFELIERLNDILEKMFRMLEYYHGYDNLCIILLTLFQDVSIEIRKKFIPKNHNEALSCEKWNRDSFSPWGMSNIDQVIDILDKEKSNFDDAQDYDQLDPPEKSVQEFFTERLEADSDDDDDDDDDDDTHSSDQRQSLPPIELSWSSPIPRTAYHLLLRFWAYADRLLTHLSRMVRIKALSLLIFLCPLLSTQQSNFLPSVAKIWTVVVQTTETTDYSQTAKAYELLTALVKYTDSFLLSRVLDFWSHFSQRSPPIIMNFSSTTRSPQLNHKISSPVIAEVHKQLSALLHQCLTQFALQIPDHVSLQMCQIAYLQLYSNSNSKHVTNMRIFLNREISEDHRPNSRQHPF